MADLASLLVYDTSTHLSVTPSLHTRTSLPNVFESCTKTYLMLFMLRLYKMTLLLCEKKKSYRVCRGGVMKFSMEWVGRGEQRDWFMLRENIVSRGRDGWGVKSKMNFVWAKFDPQSYPQLFNNASNTIYALFSATTFWNAENCDN